MFSFIFNFFERLNARIKRFERMRIRRLEADLAQVKLALAFYSRQENYPTFTLVGQRSTVLNDRGARARQALRSLRTPIPGRSVDLYETLADVQDALRAMPLLPAASETGNDRRSDTRVEPVPAPAWANAEPR